MIYKNDNWGKLKTYSLTSHGFGSWLLTEYSNGCKKTKLQLREDEKDNFLNRLEKNGWYCDYN